MTNICIYSPKTLHITWSYYEPNIEDQKQSCWSRPPPNSRLVILIPYDITLCQFDEHCFVYRGYCQVLNAVRYIRSWLIHETGQGYYCPSVCGEWISKQCRLGFLWSWWRGEPSQHSRCMRNPQFHVSGTRPMGIVFLIDHHINTHQESALVKRIFFFSVCY